VAIDTRGEAADRPSKPSGQPAKKRTTPALFYRQVVAELRKVIWPTRKALINYTIVVLVFVLIMVAIVAGLDYLLTQGVLAVFGGSTTP
jgi:preprotein translocase subunit SecE